MIGLPGSKPGLATLSTGDPKPFLERFLGVVRTTGGSTILPSAIFLGGVLGQDKIGLK